jgi:serine/threonine-protein kinase
MPFLALEWLEGETLASIAKRRRDAGWPPFPLDDLVVLLDPVARALERAHHFDGPEGPISIVHRDMKPENIFVTSENGGSVLKILDFGIGKAKSVASQVAGRAGGTEEASSFTPAYGAPEQWSPTRYGQTGPWTDVWGLALTMVELLAGRQVLEGDHATMMKRTIDPARRPTPREFGVAVSDAVEGVFQAALAVDPSDRFPDVGTFWNALLEASRAAQSEPKAHSNPLEFDLGGELGAKPSGAPPGTGASGGPPLHQNPALGAPLAGFGNLSPRADTARNAHLARAVSSLADRLPVSLPPESLATARRFLVPILLVIVGVVLTLLDGAYAAAKGEAFTLGPLHLAWFAVLAVVSGIALAILRLVLRDRDLE